MGINREKSARARLTAKMWQLTKYQNRVVNCGNCRFADQDGWDEGKGSCLSFGDSLKFPIHEEGVCKLHSAFRIDEE